MTKRLIVGTGITESYYPKTQHFRYFETLNGLPTDVVKFAVLIDGSPEFLRAMGERYPNVQFSTFPSDKIPARNPNNCIQHGVWLQTTNFDDDDYVVFTDSDITIQRPFTSEEMTELRSGKVLVAHNWRDDETLAEEATVLQLSIPPFVLENYFPNSAGLTCFNTGVLGMTVRDWKRLHKLYVSTFPLVDQAFANPAKQQWLISLLLQTRGFVLHPFTSDLVRSIHIHSHNPYRDQRLAAMGATVRNGIVCYRGFPVVFAHNFA